MNSVQRLRGLHLSLIIVISCVIPLDRASSEGPIPIHRTSISYPISSPYYPIVLTGNHLASLHKAAISAMGLYALDGENVQAIPFQIDVRDRKGRFDIPVSKKAKAKQEAHVFDLNDELVFMAGDLGSRMVRDLEKPEALSVTEVELTDPATGQQGWIYVYQFNGIPPEKSDHDYVSYKHDSDSVESTSFRVGFSKKRPFLVDRIQWKEGETGTCTQNIVDIMKVRHTGKLFHQFDFVRTQEDYKSKLIAVKEGPVRVIRKTENRIRMLWQFRTLSFDIDYLIHSGGFVMDTLMDFPFKPGLFFSELKMISTIDGKEDPSLPPFCIYSNSCRQGVVVDGKMSNLEKVFNSSRDKELVVSCSKGQILFRIDLEKNFPVQSRVYLNDDQRIADPPEKVPGQFGNVGFQLTGWEKVDTLPHHMVY